MNSSEELPEINLLHEQIDQCFACSGVPDFRKSVGLRRGECGDVFVVGQGPGRRELATKQAFAGQSGRRLDTWLIASGALPNNPRKGIYFTAVTKCFGAPIALPIMITNCRRFLHAQLRIVQPRLVITLGMPAYEALKFREIQFNDALCTLDHSKDSMLVTPWGTHCALMPWPHPSGLNRWHNESANRKRLESSFESIGEYFQTA